jgi:hypothetical protein
MNKLQMGVLYLIQAQKSLTRDFEAAFGDGDWNIAIRRAQESAEYAVKALYLLAGEIPPTRARRKGIHDPWISEELIGKIPVIWFPPQGLPSKLSGGLYVLWAEEPWCRLEVYWIEDEIFLQGQIEIFVGGRVMAIGWANGRPVPEGQWIQTPIDNPTRCRINNGVSHLAKIRESAFYFEDLFDQKTADEARAQACCVLLMVLRSLGLETASDAGEDNDFLKRDIFSMPGFAQGHLHPTVEIMLEALRAVKSP